MNTARSIFDDDHSAWVVETPGGTSADTNRVVALIGALNGLAPSVRRELIRSVALPIDYSSEGGLLQSVTLDPSWSSQRPALAAASGDWAALSVQDLTLEATIDVIDSWLVLLSIGVRLGEVPPSARLMVDGRPRMLLGLGSWSVTAVVWGGATKLPTRVSVSRSLQVLRDTLVGVEHSLPTRAADRLSKFGWNSKSEAPDVSVDRLAFLVESLRGDRSEAAVEIVLRSRLADRSARMLEREVLAHAAVAERILGADVLGRLRNQRDVERAYEAMSGHDRSAAERRSRMVASAASKSFYLDLIPEGRSDDELVRSVDLDRRFVEGDSDWIVRRVSRGDVDLADVRLATTTRVAVEELLAQYAPPVVRAVDTRWHSSAEEYVFTLEAEVDPGVNVTAVKVVVQQAGRQQDLFADFTQPDGSMVKIARLIQRLGPGGSMVISAHLAWRLGGVEALGVQSGQFLVTAPPPPSPSKEFLSQLVGHDADQEAVSATRRRLGTIMGVGLIIAVDVAALVIWGDDIFNSIFGVGAG